MERTRRTRETIRAQNLSKEIDALDEKIVRKQLELKKLKEELTLLRGLLKFYKND